MDLPNKPKYIIINVEENVWDGSFIFVVDVELNKYNVYQYYNNNSGSILNQDIPSDKIRITDTSVSVDVGTLVNGTTVTTEAWVLVYC